MKHTPTLRLRLALLVGLSAFAVLAGAGTILVRIVDQRMHDNARDEALRAVETARDAILAGIPTNAIEALKPGQPTIGFEQDDRPFGGDILSSEELASGTTVVERREISGVPVYRAALDVGPNGTYSIIATAPLQDVESTIAALRSATIIAVPLLALLLGGLALVITGRALRPVAMMRQQADAISHGTLHQRLTPVERSPELGALANTMNHMLDRLETSAIKQRRFLSDASHELRSPLTTIRAAIEVAMREPETINRAGAIAVTEIDRLEDLVRNLLTLARLDEHAAATFEHIDLDDVVTSQASSIQHDGVTIDVSQVGPVRINGDLQAIVGVIRNLLDNAVRHARSTVNITLRASTSGTAELLIDDDGSGVPPDQRDLIFERFARLDDGRSRDSGGTGLGLSVVAVALRAHDGHVSAEDSPAGGARFRVTLPLNGETPRHP